MAAWRASTSAACTQPLTSLSSCWLVRLRFQHTVQRQPGVLLCCPCCAPSTILAAAPARAPAPATPAAADASLPALQVSISGPGFTAGPGSSARASLHCTGPGIPVTVALGSSLAAFQAAFTGGWGGGAGHSRTRHPKHA